MNRNLAEGFVRDGDLEGLCKLKDTGTPLSKIFVECIDYASGPELDKMIENCLFLVRENFTVDSITLQESDVSYRNKAIALAPALDAFYRKMSGILMLGDEDLMDKWANAINATDVEKRNKIKNRCPHNWKLYFGLFQTDEYCTLCNEKKK